MRERKRDRERERGVIKREYKSNVCRKEELYMYCTNLITDLHKVP